MILLNSKQCLRVVATVVLSLQAEQYYFKVVEFPAGLSAHINPTTWGFQQFSRRLFSWQKLWSMDKLAMFF